MMRTYPVPFAPPPVPALAGPAEGAAPLIVAFGLLGGAALLGYVLWPREREQYQPNYNQRWADLRQMLRESKAREKAASADRDRKLALLSAQCRAQKRQITEQCRLERERERAQARSVKAAEKRRRDDAWANYRWHQGDKRRRRAPKMTKAESDSLAEHSVRPELIPLWRRHRKRFSYDLPPDQRVEQFMEFLHEDPELERAWLDEAIPSDAELAAAEREHYEQELEGVPF